MFMLAGRVYLFVMLCGTWAGDSPDTGPGAGSHHQPPLLCPASVFVPGHGTLCWLRIIVHSGHRPDSLADHYRAERRRNTKCCCLAFFRLLRKMRAEQSTTAQCLARNTQQKIFSLQFMKPSSIELKSSLSSFLNHQSVSLIIKS